MTTPLLDRQVFVDGLFKGKVTFIAGGTSGINLGIATAFAELGSSIFLISRSIDKVSSAVNTLAARGFAVDGFAADVRNYAAVEAAFLRCSERFGPIDFVISGAAGNFVAKAADLSSNSFQTVINIDLVGTFNVCRAAHSHLRRPGASIVNISAVQSFTSMPGQVHVCAAKAGVDAMTRVLALEWGREGIRVNAIAPGPVDGTEGMNRLTPTDGHRSRYIQSIPLGRYASISEIASVATFLCSDAGAYFNGEILVCDGAQSIVGGQGFADAWQTEADSASQ
jgi:NAD(P)-dependent dehydrogenase (short-subunit alcohol dehydrogenase family)